MSEERFIRSSDTSTFHPMQWNGLLVLEPEAHNKLRDYLQQKGAAPLIEIFARPLLANREGATLGSVAWYTAAQGDVMPLAHANAAQQNHAMRQLSDMLTPVSTVLTEQEGLGALLRRSLMVANREDILLIGGNQVVLVNWGLVPAAIANKSDKLRQHLQDTLGSYVSVAPWPSGGGLLELPELPELPEVELPDGVLPEINFGLNISESDSPQRLEAPAASGSGLCDNPWLVGIAATTLVGGGTLAGLTTRFVESPPPVSAPVVNELLAVQEGVNQSLEDQITNLRKALNGDVCANPKLPLLNTPTDSPVRPAQGASAPTSAKTIAQRLDETTFLVLVPEADDVRMGSAFLVAPNVILSNSHVVGAPSADTPIFVTNKALGGLQRATLLHATPQTPDTERLDAPDFALLKLEGSALDQVAPLPLALSVEKLAPVVAAGFPTFELGLDANFMSLLENGEMAAVPEVVMSGGAVSVVRSDGNQPTLIAHTAVVSQGNSGGPLLDRCGRAVGINTSIRLDKESLRQGNYALGGAALLAYLRQQQIPVTVAEQPCTPAPDHQ